MNYTDPEGYLLGVLYECQRNGHLSWEFLFDALESEIVHENRLARELRHHYSIIFN